MSTFPYMPLYVADYLADAAHLTTEEHGAYLLLIMTYWQRGKPLPDAPDRLANIARMSNERWASVQQTLSEFFDVINGEWRHKRIDAELEKVREKSQKAKAAGKASGRSRKTPDAEQRPNGRSTDAQRTLNHTESDTDTDNNKTISSASGTARDDGAAPKVDLQRLVTACNGALDDPVNCMGLLTAATPIMWIEAGCDLERDVIPTLEAAGKKHHGKRIRSWDYFTGAVTEARDKRRTGLPPTKPKQAEPKPAYAAPTRRPEKSERQMMDEMNALAERMGIA